MILSLDLVFLFWKNREKWNVRVRENMKQKFRGLLEFQQQVDFFEDQVLFPCHMSGDVTDNWKKSVRGLFLFLWLYPDYSFKQQRTIAFNVLKLTKNCAKLLRWTVLFHSGVSFIHYDSIEFLFCVGRGGCLKWTFVLQRGWAIIIKPRAWINYQPKKKKIFISRFLE